MPQDLNAALLVLVVGMTTVFVILCLVVLTGRLLIRLVNRYVPEQKLVRAGLTPLAESPPTEAIAPSVMAAIIAAVEQITEGKGSIRKIDKEPK